MKPGDKIVYYLTGRKAFGGIVTIESPYFESHERIWESGDPKKAAEDYPFRVNIVAGYRLAPRGCHPGGADRSPDGLCREMAGSQLDPGLPG